MPPLLLLSQPVRGGGVRLGAFVKGAHAIRSGFA
jgi:hypothetical protein